jgi:penicillin-binding protein 1C
LPPLRADCQGAVVAAAGNRTMQLIYPREATKIYVPTDLDGKLSKTIFQVAHRKPKTTIYWHLDQEFLGETTTFHQFALQPPPGKHILTLVDKDGNRLEQKFEIIRKR